MGLSKIAEKTVSNSLSANAHVLVTQPEANANGNDVESLRRIPLAVFNSAGQTGRPSYPSNEGSKK